jgi:hypothetical protein
VQELTDIFDRGGSASFSVADAFVNCRKGLLVFILEWGCLPLEVKYLRLSYAPTIILIWMLKQWAVVFSRTATLGCPPDIAATREDSQEWLSY